jgi:hypothetical protein
MNPFQLLLETLLAPLVVGFQTANQVVFRFLDFRVGEGR